MTKTLLRIDASARHEGSVSRLLADRAQARLKPDTIITRDLADGIPHLDGVWTGATFTPPEDRSAEQSAALALSDELLGEVQAADTILISAATYNFNIPSTLKAWIDQISRVGVAFNYTADGPVGLLTGKRVIVTLASGGTKLGSDNDFISPYLRFVFGFLGITDVTITSAAGAAETSVATAHFDIDALAA